MFEFPLTKCNLCQLSGNFGQGYQGDLENGDILLVGEAPGEMEEKTGLPFQGAAGQYLRGVLEEINFPMDKLVITNSVLCRPPMNRKPKTIEIKMCSENLDTLIEYMKPRFIITAGNVPLKRLIKKTGITKFHGNFFEIKDYQVFAIYHPSYIIRNKTPEMEKTFKDDLIHFLKIYNNEEMPTYDRDYYFVENLREFDIMVNRIIKAKKVAIDTETTGLNFWKNKIRSIQFSIAPNNAFYLPILEHKEFVKFESEEVIDLNDENEERHTTLYNFWKPEELDYIKKELAQKIFLNPDILITGQNFKFDHNFIDYWLFHHDFNKSVNGVVFDTMIASYLYDENSPNDLKTNSYLYFEDLRGYAVVIKDKLSKKDEDENNFCRIKLKDLLPYALGDADATYRLTNKFLEILSENAKKWLFNFYIPLHYIYQKGERRGVGLDINQLEKVKKKYQEESLKLEAKICKVAGKPDNEEIRKKLRAQNPDMDPKKFDKLAKKHIFNIGSHKQLAKVLYEEMKLPILKYTDAGNPSTNIEVLKELALKYPFCRDIVDYRNRLKMISTYLNGALKYTEKEGTIVPGYPMVHFRVNIVGTLTGRTSIKQLAVQTIPRKKEMRMIISAPPGWKLIEFDLSQAELRLAAWYSKDPVMLHEYKTGTDIHFETLVFMIKRYYKCTEEEARKIALDWKANDKQKFKERRKRAKLFNFGGLYGGCFKENSLTLTSKGFKFIQKLKAGDEVMNFMGKFKVLELHKNGVKEVFKVKLENGIEFSCTNNHLIHTPLGFKPLKELEVGSPIFCIFNTQVFNNEDKIEINSKKFKYQKHVVKELPKRLSPKLGEFIGFWIAEGGVSEPNPPRRNHFYRLTLTQGLANNSKIAFEYFLNLGKEIFGDENVKKVIDLNRKTGKIRIYRVEIVEWFMNLIGNDNYNSYNKYIPEVIKNASKEVQVGFIRGLFEGDGHYSKRRGIGLATRSERLAKEVQLLLLNMGIISKIRFSSNTYRLSIFPMHVEKFLKEIGFITKQDNEVIERKTKRYSNTAYLVDSTKFLSRIKSIEHEGKFNVYDLTVEGQPYYTVNMVSVHNSAKTLAMHINEKLDEGEEKVTEEDAQAHLDYFFGKYKGLQKYYDLVKQRAQQEKKVVSCFGRVRHLPQLNLPDTPENRMIREEAFRYSVNCVDERTQCLTKQGWKSYNELKLSDEILTKNVKTGFLEWNKLEAINIYPDYEGPMYLFENGSSVSGKNISALTTPNHRWLVKQNTRRSREKQQEVINNQQALLNEDKKLVEEILSLYHQNLRPIEISKKTKVKYIKVRRILGLTKRVRKGPLVNPVKNPIDTFLTSEELSRTQQVKSIHLRGEYPGALEKTYSDDLVEFIGWIVTDGHIRYRKSKVSNKVTPAGVSLVQSFVANSEKVDRIQKLINRLGYRYKRIQHNRSYTWRFYRETAELLDNIIPNKTLPMEFLLKLTKQQLLLLLETIQLGDGIRIITVRPDHLDSFQALIVLAGKSSNAHLKPADGRKSYSDKLSNGQKYIIKRKPSYHIRVLKKSYTHHKNTREKKTFFKEIKDFKGLVWCPTVKNSNFVCRRKDENGSYYQYITGNSPIQSTAADLVKMAMIEIDQILEQKNMRSYTSFDVHDALIALAPDNEVYDFCMIAKEIMEKERPPIIKEEIEIKSDGSVMTNWGDPFDNDQLKPFNLSKEILEG